MPVLLASTEWSTFSSSKFSHFVLFKYVLKPDLVMLVLCIYDHVFSSAFFFNVIYAFIPLPPIYIGGNGTGVEPVSDIELTSAPYLGKSFAIFCP